tara:strand:+ start:1227 stop:1952 length:726 start_codon:yes stop_codon:yes gene_type:complete
MTDQETPKPQVEVVGNPRKEEPKKEVKPTEEKLTFTKEAFNDLIEGRLARQKDSLTKEYGITPEEALSLKAEQEKAEKQKEIEKGDFEKVLKKQSDTFTKEIATLRGQLSQVQINDALTSAASKYKTNAPDQVAALLRPHIQLNKSGAVEVIDSNKKVRYNDKGGQVTIPDLVQEFLNDYPHFQASTPSGSGSVSAVGGKTVKPFNIKDLDIMGKKEDREAYAKYRTERDSKPTQINLTNK